MSTTLENIWDIVSTKSNQQNKTYNIASA